MPVTLQDAFDSAVELHQAGRVAEAESIYRQIHDQLPGEPEVLRRLAAIAVQAGRADAAVEWLRQAVVASPADPSLRNQLGYALHISGLHAEAIEVLREMLVHQPDCAEAHNNLGIALVALDRHPEAVACFELALLLAPDLAYLHGNLIGALSRCGRPDEALAAACQALATHPNDPNILNSLGDVLGVLGRDDEALEALERAVELDPQLGVAWSNGGDVLLRLGRHVEAERAYLRAVELSPHLATAWNNLGLMQYRRAQLDEALGSFERALAIAPGDGPALVNQGNVLKEGGRIGEALKSYGAAICGPCACKAHSNFLVSMHYLAGQDPALVFAEHRRWDRLYARGLLEKVGFGNPAAPERRLRVGYVSPDFRDHPVGRFMQPLLACHDRAEVEVHAFVDLGYEDEVSMALKAQADRWHAIAGRSDAAVAELIRAEQIDILVDLAGHTAENRLLVFARRAAPVQVSYLGYPDTTGVGEIDYRLTDSLADPGGEADLRHSEEPVRIDPCAWVCPLLPDVPIAARRAGPMVFGCCNTLAKVSDGVVSSWGRILALVPGSRLLLKANGWVLGSARQRVLVALASHGVAADRVEFAGLVPDPREHFEFIGRIDIALDTFPYHGTSTTFDALWMGVPVITLGGDTHVARVGVSLLTNLGHPEWIAASEEELVAKAVALAAEPLRLANLRTSLRDEVLASPLGDAGGLARRVESSYRQMWRRWCGETRGNLESDDVHG
jgi:protein O-GlcNAc transferase